MLTSYHTIKFHISNFHIKKDILKQNLRREQKLNFIIVIMEVERLYII